MVKGGYKMNVLFYGGKQAGLIVLLSIMSSKHTVKYIIPEDQIIQDIAESLKITTISKKLINEPLVLDLMRDIDLLVCCHGRQILKGNILKMKCINVHPCLYKYKGTEPIHKLIAEKNERASVGVHYMVEKVDAGEVIIEIFKQVELGSVIDIYNQLYPVYSKVILKALRVIE